MDHITTNCLNCETIVPSHFNYCGQCGQKNNLHRISLHDIFHDAVHFFLHADKSIFSLIKSLATKTGLVAKEFVAGKRKKYFPPLNFFLLVATIFVLSVTAAFGHKDKADVRKEHPEIAKIPSAETREMIYHIYEKQAIAIQFINKYSNFVAMIAAPLFALIYYLVFLKGRYNYAEHLIANLYMIGFGNLVYALIVVPVSAMLGFTSKIPSLTLLIIYALFNITYDGIFYYKFLGKDTTKSLVGCIAVSLFKTVFWFAVSGFAVAFYIMH